MFDHKHYVPILRWKPAEWKALRDLKHKDKVWMTPLVEIPSAGFTSGGVYSAAATEGKLTKIVKDIRVHWGTSSLFVDLGLLHQNVRAAKGIHPLEAFGRMARSQRSFLPEGILSFIPVTGLNRSPAYQTAVASLAAADRRGACIRLLCTDILRSTFPNDMKQLLSELNLGPSAIDLLVDYQVIDEYSPPFASICARIPSLSEWRSFTVGSGAFTRDLRDFEKNSQHFLSRLDWLTWKDQVTAESALGRIPTYGDYTIQHAIYYPRNNKVIPNISASIRYTAEDNWVIMRGEGIRNDDGPGPNQWPANAYLLCQRDEFCGADFSAGDAYFMRMGSQLENGGIKERGGAATWLQAGINHHLTFVVRQIASLFDPSTVVAL